jgi:hypothetical protein
VAEGHLAAAFDGDLRAQAEVVQDHVVDPHLHAGEGGKGGGGCVRWVK